MDSDSSKNGRIFFHRRLKKKSITIFIIPQMESYTIKTITDNEITVKFETGSAPRIKELKRKVAESQNCNPNSVKFFLKGKELDDELDASKFQNEILIVYFDKLEYPSKSAMIDMINELKMAQPDEKICITALRKARFDIVRAMEIMFPDNSDSQLYSDQSCYSVSHNEEYSKNNKDQGKRVNLEPNPYQYTDPNQNSYILGSSSNSAKQSENSNEDAITKLKKFIEGRDINYESALEIFEQLNFDFEKFKAIIE